MKSQKRMKIVSFGELTAVLMMAYFASGCSLVNMATSKSAGGFGASNNLSSNSNGNLGGSSDSGFSDSANTQSVSAPTADAVVGRILKAIPSITVNSTNFKKALAQVGSNLPDSADPTKATGLEQIPILVYAACADVKPATYNVNTSTAVSANMTNLVNAGVTMVNAHVGGLASNAAVNSQVVATFTQLINDDVSAGANTAMTFISVCLAANSFGIGMVGF